MRRRVDIPGLRLLSRILVLFSLFAAALATPEPARALVVCFVNDDAPGPTHDGSSWAHAYTSLQTALPGCPQIWVAAGLYKPGAAQTDTFTIPSGTKVYGGFAGTEFSVDQRNPLVNASILSGDIDNNDVNSDGNHIDEVVANIVGANSYHVLTMNGYPTPITNSTVLDSFYITGGDGGSTQNGGGLICLASSSGAGYACSPMLNALNFSGNRAANGGALYNSGQGAGASSPAISLAIFSGNEAAYYGGAVFNSGYGSTSNPSFFGVYFADNHAGTGGGAVDNYGENGGHSNPSFLWVRFKDNTAGLYAGAVLNDGGLGESNPSFTLAAFINNGADTENGGAVYNTGTGGAASPSLTDVTFYGNHSATEGGAMFNDGVSSPSLTNVTFSGNSAGSSGGAMFNAGATATPALKNVILWGDSGGSAPEVSNGGGTPTFAYSIVQGSGGSTSWSGPGTDLGGNLDVDPLLQAPADNGGLTETMALGVGSPAIDTGTNSGCLAVDQRGSFRPVDGDGSGSSLCDIGAYELQGNLNAYVAGSQVGGYNVGPSTAVRASYATVNDGPVKVTITGASPLVASERVAYWNGSAWTSFAELMGMPLGLLTDTYYLPWYNNVDLNTQVRFGNVGASPTTVNVTVGGVSQGAWFLNPSQSVRVSFAGLNNGPVVVHSSGGVQIVASERVAYYNGSAWTSFSEIMGLPASQLTTQYLMPWYNNVDLNSQLRFGNVGSSSTTVSVTIGGVPVGSYFLLPSQSTRISYPAANNGPVVVQSTGGVPIVASERVAYYDGSNWTSFAELMGLPANLLTDKYVMPWYDDVNLNTQLRFGNVGGSSTTVSVTVGGVPEGSWLLAPSQSTRIFLAGVSNGPVVVQSTGGVPIVASMREAYYNGSAWTSFAEMMGLPGPQLTSAYLMPWYNNVDLDTQLRFGVP